MAVTDTGQNGRAGVAAGCLRVRANDNRASRQGVKMNAAVRACAALAVSVGWACGGPQPTAAEARVDVAACLAMLMQSLDQPTNVDDPPGSLRVSCAQPYGTMACSAAWLAARKAVALRASNADAPFVAPEGAPETDAAIRICVPQLCADLAEPRPHLCGDEAQRLGGFAGYVAWQELHRAVLERDLGHPRALGILGFLAGVMRPGR